MTPTEQMQVWSGDFGKEYTNRNKRSLEGRDARNKELIGVTRSELNRRFLDGLDRSMRILEVGCNIGLQLMLLKQMGFEHLYGIELQEFAVQESRSLYPELQVTQASALNLPFEDRSFDMVFTSGFLIHISPQDLTRAMGEIIRVARTYIFGYEYFETQMTEVNYRGHDNLLWKADYRAMYQNLDPELLLVKEEKFPYLDNDNVDCMFLLRRRAE